MGTVIFAVL